LIEERQFVIEGFLEMCQRYYSHNIKREDADIPSDYCQVCIIPLVEFEDNFQCSRCLEIYEKKQAYSSLKDSSTIVSDHMKHIEKQFDRHIGSIAQDMPAELYRELTERAESLGFIKNGKPSGENSSATNSGVAGISRVDYVRLIFGFEKTKPYYQDANYILLKWIKLPLPSYKSERQEILELCKDFAEWYVNFEDREMDSFPNGLYLLFKTLELLGEDIQLDEIKPSISIDTLDRYDSIWEQFCIAKGYTYIRSR